MTSHKMKRFYKAVNVAPDGKGWCVQLDGRPVKTPARAPLSVPSEALAEAVADEWRQQGDEIDIAAMHLTRLVNVAIDRTPDMRKDMSAEVVKYCETDLLCFLAEGPEDLVDRQKEAWRPVREWVGKELDIVLMEVPGSVLAAPQPPASLEAAQAYALSLDDVRLTGLAFGLGLFGSALLSAAACGGYITAIEANERSILEEIWQAETWGSDPENERRLENNRRQAQALHTLFFSLIQKK